LNLNFIKINTAILLFLISTCIYSQDTINFRGFDSLKTSAEDNGRIKTKKKNILLLNEKFGPDPDNIDIRIFRSINNSQTPFKTKVLNVTDRSMLPVSMLVPSSMLVYGRLRRKTYEENTGYLMSISSFTNIAVTFAAKTLVKRQRPFKSLRNVHMNGTPALDVYSFPSGHTSSGFAMATMLALRYPEYPLVYAPVYVWSLIVAYGRPYFGMHYPSDLLAGALIGTGTSVIVHSLRKELFKFKNQVLGEDKEDTGSLNSGAISFFACSFIASAVVDTFITGRVTKERMFISPWMDGKRGGMKIQWKL
jgi:hypothetical protein